MNSKNLCIHLLLLFTVQLTAGCIPCNAMETYAGRAQDAEWRRKALERIDKFRKAQMVVEVVDKKGTPLSNAQVKIEMQRHAFAFGSAVTAYDLSVKTDDATRYRKLVEKNFNKVVFENDLKWGPWETGKGPASSFYRMEYTQNALKWLSQREISVRGHYLVWGHLEGDAGTDKRKGLPPDNFKAAVLRHAEEKTIAVGTRVSEWDVVNHPIGWDRGTIADLFGKNFYNSVFEQVAKWNPKAMRYINEGGVLPHNGYNQEKYFHLIAEMRKSGAKIEGIGFMGHFKADRDLAAPEELLATFDRFAKFGLPLQVTEFDVRFGNEMGKPFPLTQEQEALQADYMRDFLIAAFSHPALEGVIMWGFWEGRHWYPDAALYRKDWSIKPNGSVWEDLVLRQWWTNVAGSSDNRGKFSTRGFLGTYRIEVTHNGKKKVLENVKLEKSGKVLRIVIE